MNEHNQDRRTFLKTSIAATAGICHVFPECISESRASAESIPKRRLGKTNEMVTMIGLGGGNVGHIKDDKTAFDVIAAALDQGIEFFDTAWRYHSKDRKVQHQCEIRYAKGLKGKLVDGNGWLPTVVEMEFEGKNGQKLRLCDFASAGEGGTPYVSWLKVKNAPSTPFSAENPLRSGRV